MKKPLFIIIAAFIALIVILVWIYLMFFNKNITPENIFTGFLNGEENTSLNTTPPSQAIDNNQVNLDRQSLRQLTTRPVASFREIKQSASSSPELYYVEMGTGHIYSINTETGEERRLSGSTVVQANEAVISAKGDYFAIASYNNDGSKRLTVGWLDRENNFLEERLVETVHDFSIGISNELLYTTAGDNGLLAYTYNLETAAKQSIFSLPFFEAKMQWGTSSAASHFVYPKSSFAATGFLYEIKNGKLVRLPLSGYGFSALATSKYVLYTKLHEEKPTSFFFDRATGISKPITIDVLPEKCTAIEILTVFVCPRDRATPLPYETPDEWYKGNLGFKDAVWQLNPVNVPGGVIFDTLDSGREIDIIKLDDNLDLTAFFFTNKNDNTLWMYELYP